MTISGILAALGGLIVLGIIVKGFWGGDRVKPIEQPDNWQNHTSGGPGEV
ncbi:hypothetical protein [Mesorhizobium sp. Mes31]|nr:hypothetical protein [Mesorhizobium sp. Mes31]